MSEAFLRDYKLTILNPKEVNANISEDVITDDVVKFFSRDESVSSNYKDYRTKYSLYDKLEIHDLNFDANITYSSSSDSSGSQVSTFKVYNLSKESLKTIKKNASVILEAGYLSEKSLPMLFTGLIESIDTQRVGENQVTSFSCKDSGLPLRGVRASISFVRETTYKTIILTLMDRLARKGVPKGEFLESSTYTPLTHTQILDSINPPSTLELQEREDSLQSDAIKYGVPVDYFKYPTPSLDTPLLNGYSVEGNIFEELKRVCKAIGFRAYVVLGKLYVEPIDEPIGKARFTLKEDQIRGGIKRQTNSSSKGQNSSEGKEGIIVETFLNGRITANKILSITHGGDFKGDYKITSVTHKLNFEGSNWITICKCIGIGG